ncbi:helix-turn-helix transcriptional regulator [Vibrio quintilis]|uniref:helix-turn-helix transcriptional regulator n=1 Tax=Vibrio quintilis TaxID=1117707 RepID=UPI0009360092|nr:AlpA family transcriptional regulator [Vibrio quintilis]
MKILRLKEVMAMCGIKKTAIYSYMEQGYFPKSVPLGGRAVGWVESEVIDWINARIQERDEQNAA